jgi:lipopolysaccharide transport system ATP-binding protein
MSLRNFMGDIAIRAEALSKLYNIGTWHQRHDSMRELLAHGMRNIFQRHARRGADATTIWALQDVSLEIKRGEAVGIIGRNGSGKSTLLKILSRVTDPTKGRAMICGRFCSLLEVGTGFHADLTGRENIYLSGAILGMRKAEIDRKFNAIVEFAEIRKFIDTPVKYYSSGMYVRLGFSVAAHMEPDILIVDEVLAVGDGLFQKKCMNKMQDVGQLGQTVLFVSHDMAAITRLCNRAILLEQGRVLRDGPSHEVVAEYLYSGQMNAVSEWPDPARAPGDEIVRMRAVRIRTEDGQTTNTVDIRQAVRVEIEYDVLEPGHILVPSFGFSNEEGICAFLVNDRDPAWRRKTRPPGRFVSTAWIPGNFLSEGTLIVGAGIVTESPWHLHCDVPGALAFHVVENSEVGAARGDSAEKWIGVVRPFLKWTTQHSRL